MRSTEVTTMPKRRIVLLTTLIAVAALSIAASTSFANRGAEVSNGNEVLIIFNELEFSGGGGEIICGVTLHASIHRTIAKIRGTLAGYVRGVLIDIANCEEGEFILETRDVRVLNLP